ncbi:F-box domain [Dillenia turbinata]|uniref:F-box domain n=1 Tax=Dillenia turbinata TaxID=194707 RepID=A0AAN8W801_9MAGN
MASSSGNIEEDMQEERSTDSNADTVNSWSDLPRDLLPIIADHLGLVKFLSFRGVCREWRMVSSTASAEIQLRKLLWFLCVDPEDRYILYTSNFQESFKIIVPDHYVARCLASDQGWLPVFKQGSASSCAPSLVRK